MTISYIIFLFSFSSLGQLGVVAALFILAMLTFGGKSTPERILDNTATRVNIDTGEFLAKLQEAFRGGVGSGIGTLLGIALLLLGLAAIPSDEQTVEVPSGAKYAKNADGGFIDGVVEYPVEQFTVFLAQADNEFGKLLDSLGKSKNRTDYLKSSYYAAMAVVSEGKNFTDNKLLFKKFILHCHNGKSERPDFADVFQDLGCGSYSADQYRFVLQRYHIESWLTRRESTKNGKRPKLEVSEVRAFIES